MKLCKMTAIGRLSESGDLKIKKNQLGTIISFFLLIHLFDFDKISNN